MYSIRDLKLTVRQVALLTELGEAFIRREIAAGRLPATKPGPRTIFIKQADIEPFVERVKKAGCSRKLGPRCFKGRRHRNAETRRGRRSSRGGRG